jgi:hypothetical protein
VTFASCANSRDCGTDKVCDPGRGICVECAQGGDCASNQACVLNKCVSTATCESNGDCGAKVCDTSGERCVDCLTDAECVTDTEKCVQNTCRTACTSDKQCTSQGMLCDTATSGCVQCKVQTDCPSSTYCEAGACKADICDSTQSTCSGNGIAACNAAGNGWAAAQACPASQGCIASGGVASCGGNPPIDGGNPPIDGGPPPTDAPLTCTTATATPCTSIPKFNGTQTVDGKDDDFCDVPSFVFDKPSAKVVNNYNGIQDSEFPSVSARVAWSPAGLHAFFNVTDASVESVLMASDQATAISTPYQGDSIELFISSSDNATGVPGGDNGAVHVTLAATGPSVSVKTTAGPTTTYTELPAAQYSQAKTATGYAVEVLLPWQGAAPSGGGKVRFDLALNIADSNLGGVGDMRDAQLIYYLGTVSGGCNDAWCDDRTWCSTTLEQ